MSKFCNCDGTLLNTGVPNSQKVISDGTVLYFVPLVSDAGAKNGIAIGDTINQSYIDAKVQNADKSQRWYPVGKFTNVTDERADPITETFSDGSNAITQEGLRTFVGWLIGFTAAYLPKLDSFRCEKFGIIAINDCGDLIGKVSSDGQNLYPIQVNEKSLDSRLIKKSDTLSGKVQLSFEFAQTEYDGDLRVIPTSEMEADADWLDTPALLDAEATISAISTTGFTAAVAVKSDGTFSGSVVTGRTTAGFTVFNVTTNSSVSVSGATEAPEGTYVITFSAQTSTDVLRVSGIENGVEIISQEITIP